MSRAREIIAKKMNSTPECLELFGEVDYLDIVPIKGGPRRDVARWECRGWICLTGINESARKDYVIALAEFSREIYCERRDLM